MQRFTVIWWLPARDDLTTLWIDASDRDAITRAANDLDRTLSIRPDSQGIDVREGLRKLAMDPIEVQFSVEVDDARVIIWSVQTASNKPN